MTKEGFEQTKALVRELGGSPITAKDEHEYRRRQIASAVVSGLDVRSPQLRALCSKGVLARSRAERVELVATAIAENEAEYRYRKQHMSVSDPAYDMTIAQELIIAALKALGVPNPQYRRLFEAADKRDKHKAKTKVERDTHE